MKRIATFQGFYICLHLKNMLLGHVQVKGWYGYILRCTFINILSSQFKSGITNELPTPLVHSCD